MHDVKETWQIGELAKRSGLSVRTLRYYDQIGLLVPSGRTNGGYRLYGEADVARLQQILSLRELGFSLERIRACLDDDALSPYEIARLHLAQVRKRVEVQQKLCRRLEAIVGALQAQRAVSAAQFLKTIEVMKMAEAYEFTPEQMEKIKQQGEKLGPEKIREVEREWPELIAKVKAEMEKGTPPSDERVQQLARRWHELGQMFTGGDPGIAKTLGTRYRKVPGYAEQYGLSAELFDYVRRASE